MEKILRIESVNFKKEPSDWNEYEGFQIITTDQTIKIGISSGQSCCEHFGCIITNDDTKDFIGAKIKSISRTDNELKTTKIKTPSLDEGGVMFINVETSKGLLQFVAYNSHNGYYGHDAVLVSNQLNISDAL